MKKLASLAALALMLMVSPASAAVITFDDQGSYGGLLSDYAGLVWNNFNYQTGTAPQVVSGDKYAYNYRGNVAVINTNWPTIFTFNGGSFTASNTEGMRLRIVGEGPNQTRYEEIFTLSTSAPLTVSVAWKDINYLTFYPNADNPFAKDWFSVDNLVVSNFRDRTSNVPLPAALPLFGTGLVALAAKARKRKTA